MKPICIDANVFIASTKGNETYSSGCRRVIQAVADGKFHIFDLSRCIKNMEQFPKNAIQASLHFVRGIPSVTEQTMGFYARLSPWKTIIF